MGNEITSLQDLDGAAQAHISTTKQIVISWDRAHNNNFISSYIYIQEQPNAMAVHGIDCKANKTRAHTAKTLEVAGLGLLRPYENMNTYTYKTTSGHIRLISLLHSQQSTASSWITGIPTWRQCVMSA